MHHKTIDTHCHPQLPAFDADRDEVIRRALDAGVGMICVGTNQATSRQAIELASRYEGIYTSVGSHPIDEDAALFDAREYEMLAQHPSVVAIGEIGLDYFHTKDPLAHQEQKDRFRAQVEIANKIGKPLIIHCRDAHDDMLRVIQGRGVIHSFNGTAQQAHAYIQKGFSIGLNAIVTFSPSYQEMVKALPLSRILLETDAPYLSPAPYRGKRNEPLRVITVGDAIAGIRGERPEDLHHANITNARALFGMKE